MYSMSTGMGRARFTPQSDGLDFIKTDTILSFRQGPCAPLAHDKDPGRLISKTHRKHFAMRCMLLILKPRLRKIGPLKTVRKPCAQLFCKLVLVMRSRSGICYFV